MGCMLMHKLCIQSYEFICGGQRETPQERTHLNFATPQSNYIRRTDKILGGQTNG